MQSILFKLQEAVAIRLRRRRDFSRIPVLTRKNGELSARVKEAIALGGLCVVIMPPRPHKVDAAQNTPVITELELCVRVVESAFQNLLVQMLIADSKCSYLVKETKQVKLDL